MSAENYVIPPTPTLLPCPQINGKVRATFDISPDATQEQAVELALQQPNVQKFTAGAAPGCMHPLPCWLLRDSGGGLRWAVTVLTGGGGGGAGWLAHGVGCCWPHCTAGKEVKKIIFVPGKILNLIVPGK